MRKEDVFRKNHLLGIEFDRYLVEHPDVLEQIPEDAEIFFLWDEDTDLSEQNLQMAETRRGSGKDILLVRVGRLSPQRSRLEGVRLETLSAA